MSSAALGKRSASDTARSSKRLSARQQLGRRPAYVVDTGQEGEGFIQAGGSALCKRAADAERFSLIEALADRFSVFWLCKQLAVAPSGFYAWRQRQQNPGPRAKENAAITTEVAEVFEQHHGFYGAPRIHQELRATGRLVGRHRVARLMRLAVLKT